MVAHHQASEAAAAFRAHFDQFFLGVIPKLLTPEGHVLAFVAMLTATEALAGAYAPQMGSGERFKAFVEQYFPEEYKPWLEALWKFRNRMIHAFNPGPVLLTCHHSRMHLKTADEIPMLNAEDMYADLVRASRGYFEGLYRDPVLQGRFERRMKEEGGGQITARTITEQINRGAAV